MVRVFSCLQRNTSSGILYFRCATPKSFKLHFGNKGEVKRSLGTHGKQVAILKAAQLSAVLQSRFNEIEEASPPGREALEISRKLNKAIQDRDSEALNMGPQKKQLLLLPGDFKKESDYPQTSV
jgi:hypothetical protein